MFKKSFDKKLRKVIHKSIPVSPDKIVVYAQAQHGAVMMIGRYTVPSKTKIQQVMNCDKIQSLITNHFNEMSDKGEPWSTLTYFEQNGEYRINFEYTADDPEEFEVMGMMNFVCDSYFPGLEIEPVSFS